MSALMEGLATEGKATLFLSNENDMASFHGLYLLYFYLRMLLVKQKSKRMPSLFFIILLCQTLPSTLEVFSRCMLLMPFFLPGFLAFALALALAFALFFFRI